MAQLTAESWPPVPKMSPSGWNWAQVSGTGAVGSVTFEIRRPVLENRNISQHWDFFFGTI